MPTTTFFNLSKEKKERIMSAALNEFSERSMEQALVSNIIKETGISRGAFYKYFEDMEDLYIYFFSQIKVDSHEEVIKCIQQAQGDLFMGLEYFFKNLLRTYSSSKYRAYFKVMSLNMNYSLSLKLEQKQAPDNKENANIQPNVDLKNFRFSDKEETVQFFNLLMVMIHQLLNDYFNNQWSEEKVINVFRTYMNWLKNGVLQ